MSAWWLSGLLVIFLFGTVVNSKLDVKSPLTLAHCRATCLHKVHIPLVSDVTCQASVNCSQCWRTCEMLQKNRSICGQHACGPGCLEACRFKSASSSQRPPVLLTNHEETLGFNSTNVYWPKPFSRDIPVFLVMGREATEKPWSQICQTLDTSARIPPNMDLDTLRVLLIDWRGLAKVFSPPRAEFPMAQVEKVIRSLGLQNRMTFKHSVNQRFLQDNSFNNLNSYDTENKSWRLREISMIHQSGLVLTQISWNTQNFDSDSQLMYLVTWEVGGGVLRGNLVTNSTCVTLSLWENTLYKIQVAVLNPEVSSSCSEPLVLDTHHAESSGSVDHFSDTELTNVHPEMVAGVAVAVAFFLMVTLTLTWRWHHRLSLPHFKLVDEDIGTPNLYRVFPPAIRLLSEPNAKPDISSSTDNLLQATYTGTRK